MIDPIVIALAAFACFRLAEMAVYDDLPFDVMDKIRIRAGVYDRDANGRAKTNLGRLLSCPHCIGIWVAAVAALVLVPLSAQTFLIWLALAGAQSFLHEIGGRR